MTARTWQGRARILSIVDGDTVEVVLDLGFHIAFRTHVRLAGINAPEMSTNAGVNSRAHLLLLLSEGDIVTVRSLHLDKYQRALAYITRADGSDVGELLVREHAASGADSSLNPKNYEAPPPPVAGQGFIVDSENPQTP